MKKQTKKLVLARETVRSLARSTFGEVAGGNGGGWPFGSNESTCTYYNSCLRYCLEEPIGP